MSAACADGVLIEHFFDCLGGLPHIAARPNSSTQKLGVGWTPRTVQNAFEGARLASAVNNSGACTYFAYNQPIQPWAIGGRGEGNIALCLGALIDIDDTRPSVLDALVHRAAYRPAYVAFTGGGYQAWWRFSTPLTNIEDARRIGFGLKLDFEDLRPDSTFSVDHLARLVGTRNRKAGRGDALVRLAFEDWDQVLPVDSARRADPKAVRSREPIVVRDWAPSPGSKPHDHLPRRALLLLDNRPLHYFSRSEHEWAFLGACHRGRVPPEIVRHYLLRYMAIDDDERIGHRSYWHRVGDQFVARRDPESHVARQIAAMYGAGAGQ